MSVETSRAVARRLRPEESDGGGWLACHADHAYGRFGTHGDCAAAINAERRRHGLAEREFHPPRPAFALPASTRTYRMPEKAPAGFADRLDGDGLVDHVVSTAGAEICEEVVRDMLGDATAVLRLLPTDRIVEGDAACNQRSARAERRYFRRSPATMPPIVLREGAVLDGNHRLRVARSRGVDRMWCYVVDEDDERTG